MLFYRVLLNLFCFFLLTYPQTAFADSGIQSTCELATEPGFTEDLWYTLKTAQETCFRSTSEQECVHAPPTWPRNVPAIIEFYNISALGDSKDAAEEHFFDMAEKLNRALDLQVSYTPNPDKQSLVGNIIILSAEDEIVDFFRTDGWAFTNSERFKTFLKGDSTTTFQWRAFEQGLVRGSIIFARKDADITDTYNRLLWHVISSFGLTYLPEVGAELSEDDLSRLLAMTSLIYSLPLEDLPHLNSAKDVSNAITKTCSKLLP